MRGPSNAWWEQKEAHNRGYKSAAEMEKAEMKAEEQGESVKMYVVKYFGGGPELREATVEAVDHQEAWKVASERGMRRIMSVVERKA